jgi:hypothetical protein
MRKPWHPCNRKCTTISHSSICDEAILLQAYSRRPWLTLWTSAEGRAYVHHGPQGRAGKEGSPGNRLHHEKAAGQDENGPARWWRCRMQEGRRETDLPAKHRARPDISQSWKFRMGTISKHPPSWSMAEPSSMGCAAAGGWRWGAGSVALFEDVERGSHLAVRAGEGPPPTAGIRLRRVGVRIAVTAAAARLQLVPLPPDLPGSRRRQSRYPPLQAAQRPPHPILGTPCTPIRLCLRNHRRCRSSHCPSIF